MATTVCRAIPTRSNSSCTSTPPCLCSSWASSQSYGLTNLKAMYSTMDASNGPAITTTVVAVDVELWTRVAERSQCPHGSIPVVQSQWDIERRGSKAGLCTVVWTLKAAGPGNT